MTSQQKSSGSRKERDKEREVEDNRREAQDALARGIEILSLHRPTHTRAVEQASSRGSHPDEASAAGKDWNAPAFERPVLLRVPFENEVKKTESDEEKEEIFSKYQKARERARRQRKRERKIRMETEDQLSSDEDDGTSNSLGMQLLEYMKNPGNGWKSQDEQLIVQFKEAQSTPFELPEGADIPELVKPPEPGSTIIPWLLKEDVAKERKMTEQAHVTQRDKRVTRALRTIESGEDHLDLSHLHLDDEAAVKCAEKLKTSFGMKKFSISLNHITFEGARALGVVLAPLPRLTSLSFSYNSLGSEGAATLARCLAKSSVLTELNLDHNGIGPMMPPGARVSTSMFVNWWRM